MDVDYLYGGTTSATFWRSNLAAGFTNEFRCVVTNLYGSDTSAEATLTVTNAPEVIPYLLNEGFEAAGYDNPAWYTNVAGAMNPDWTGAPLKGSQSLIHLSATAASIRYDLGSTNRDLWVAGMTTRTNSLVKTDTYLTLENGAGVYVCRFYSKSGTNADVGVVVITNGVYGTSGVYDTSAFWTNSETIYFWLRHLDNGSAGTNFLYWSRTSTRPGSPSVSASTDGISGVRYVTLGGGGATTTWGVVYDNIKVATNADHVATNP